jgi:hypothetical protein
MNGMEVDWSHYDLVPLSNPLQYDFFVKSHDSILLFALPTLTHHDSRLKVFLIRSDEVRKNTDTDQQIAALEAPFKEPFRVYVDAQDNYYFLTDSGHIYLAAAPAKGQPRQVKPLWVEKDRPIVALITDGDGGPAYVFGQDRRAIINARHFFFPLTPTPKPQEYDQYAVKPVKTEQPMKTVLECIQVLKAHGIDMPGFHPPARSAKRFRHHIPRHRGRPRSSFDLAPPP